MLRRIIAGHAYARREQTRLLCLLRGLLSFSFSSVQAYFCAAVAVPVPGACARAAGADGSYQSVSSGPVPRQDGRNLSITSLARARRSVGHVVIAFGGGKRLLRSDGAAEGPPLGGRA